MEKQILIFLKPAVEDVVNKYLDCGDLSKGFARLHCDKCNKDYLLAFSCKGRWFCPSCHQKKVLLFGEFFKESVAYPLPHRQYVFSLPKMLRIYFRNERQLLKRLFAIAELATPSLSASANGIKVGLRSRLASLVIWSRITHWDRSRRLSRRCLGIPAFSGSPQDSSN